MIHHGALLLALLAIRVHGLVCPGTPYFSDLTLVTRASAPMGFTNLTEWCTQYGLQLASVSFADLANINLLRGDCAVLQGTTAVRAVNGMAWYECVLVSDPLGFQFPNDPVAECGAVEAVVCAPLGTVTEATNSTITVKTKTTITLNALTITETDSRTSSRLKTLPCGTSTSPDTLTLQSTITDTLVVTSTTTVNQPTAHCPKQTLHICPTHTGNLFLIAGGSMRKMADREQARCACEQVKMRLAPLYGDVDVERAGEVLFECMSGGQSAWFEGGCVTVDSRGRARIGQCRSAERLPVICQQIDDGCGVDCPLRHQVLLQHDGPTTCGDTSIQLIYYDSFTAITSVCSQAGMVPMDYRPDLYSSAVQSIASGCAFTGPGWVRSLNGSVAECQFLQVGNIAVTNYIAGSGCTGTAGVWCVATGTSAILSTFTTDTFTNSLDRTITVTVPTTTTTTQASIVVTLTSTTTTDTVTTIRSLVLTPVTTSTVLISTTTSTNSITTTTTTVTTLVVNSTTTVY